MLRTAPPSRHSLVVVVRAIACLGVLLGAGCGSPAASRDPAPEGPYVLVLGTAQDAGLPQIGCRAACCEAARADPARRRFASALLVVDPASGGRWLLDCGPDLREQVEAMRGHPPTRALPGARPPLVDAVFLTHAHMGHVAGLLHLGNEAYAARDLPVHGTASMAAFLAGHQPWALLVSLGNVRPVVVEPGVPTPLRGPDGAVVPGLTVTAFRVPHRDEVTDTVGFVVDGPSASLAYLPDIDKWERWERPLEELLASVDVALLDGTFFADGEVPGRALADIPHPFVSETIARLAAQPASLRSRVVFTHLNHGNPAADPTSAAAAAVRDAGMRVAREGDVFGL